MTQEPVRKIGSQNRGERRAAPCGAPAGRGRRRRGFHHTRRPCIPLARPWVRPLRRRPARPCPAPAFPNFDPHRARGTGRGIAGQPGRGRARRCVRLIAQERSCRLNQDLSCQCGAGQILRQLQASVLQSGSARRRRQGARVRAAGGPARQSGPCLSRSGPSVAPSPRACASRALRGLVWASFRRSLEAPLEPLDERGGAPAGRRWRSRFEAFRCGRVPEKSRLRAC